MNYKYIQNPLGMAGIYLAFGKAGAIGERTASMARHTSWNT